MQLLSDFKAVLAAHNNQGIAAAVEGYRTRDVRKILGCSVNKLVSLRTSRKLRWKKIGGTVYYCREDVRRLLEEGF
ncbi:helix-turn-helix domain-containing protein [Puia sp.]|uniref:helix-turn-helix domain-containing protein n=1 Tax=Puia sp. TaxID=2045100 RepID=UPI0039C98398